MCGLAFFNRAVFFGNKTRKPRVGAISKAQKAQSFKICPGRIMKSSENSFETPKGRLSCWRLGNQFSPSGNKRLFLRKKLRTFFFWKVSHSAEKCKRGPLGVN